MKNLGIFLLLSFQLGIAQTLDFSEKNLFSADTYIGTDAYKNQYFVQEMAFYKKGPDGNYVFKDFSLGPISTIDIINPLKIMLFYQQTNTVIFVDNRLNEIERINFNELDQFVNVSEAGNAGNNRIWFFNIDTQQLELYDYRGQRITFVSQPFQGELVAMTSNFNFCYLLFEDRLVSFNIYGSFLSEINFEGGTQVEQLDENVWVARENELYFIPEPGLHSLEKPSEIKKIALPEITIKQLHLTQEFLYIYDGNLLQAFSVKQPKKK